MDFFILGSCVTRDIFRVANKDEEVKDYFARTTLKSLMSPALEVGEINLKSEFQKKIVSRDFDKSLFDTLKNTEFEYLIIDFIDERFNLLKVGETYITRSNELVASGLENNYEFETINKNTIEYQKEWEIAAQQFVEKIKGIVPFDKIILHEAYWAKSYIENGEIKHFPNPEYINKNNQILKKYYETIQKLLPVKVLQVGNPIGDANHIWGLSQFHYTDDYYHGIFAKLEEISKEHSLLNID